MKLRDRITRLEKLHDRSGLGNCGGVRTIIIRGGLPDPLCAMLPGTDLELKGGPSESLTEFEHRTVEWAHGLGAETVVISGVPVIA